MNNVLWERGKLADREAMLLASVALLAGGAGPSREQRCRSRLWGSWKLCGGVDFSLFSGLTTLQEALLG
jgi:hypothetical protein